MPWGSQAAPSPSPTTTPSLATPAAAAAAPLPASDLVQAAPRTTVPAANPTLPTPPSATVDMRAAIAKAMRSAIIINARVPLPTDKDNTAIGAGSVVEPGFALTDSHVVEGATKIYYERLEANGERTLHHATVVGRAPRLDIALLKLDDASQPPAELAAKDLTRGEPYAAIGAPWGYEWSSTIGYVTGEHRSMPGNDPLCDCGQVNGGVNEGDSGGGVYNSNGQLAGQVVAIHNRAQSLGFIIPASEMRAVIARLHQGDIAPRPFGATLEAISLPWAAANNVTTLEGAVVGETSGAAARAGLKSADIIVAISGQRVHGVGDASVALELIPVGQRFAMVVERRGQRITINATR